MTLIHPQPRRRFADVFAGSHVTLPAVAQHVGARSEMVCQGQVAKADGERIAALPAQIEVRPNAPNALG